MVVDDDPLMRLFVGEVLARAGHRVLRAGSASEALAALATETPTLFVLDHRMPGTDGIELARHLRATARFADTPVVMLTADSAADVESAFTAGIDSHLTKPVVAPALLELVAALLRGGRPRALPAGVDQP
jgi:CheY-like chemotaxis protein